MCIFEGIDEEKLSLRTFTESNKQMSLFFQCEHETIYIIYTFKNIFFKLNIICKYEENLKIWNDYYSYLTKSNSLELRVEGKVMGIR